MIRIEVVYALPHEQVVEQLSFADSATPVTIAQAIRASTMLQRFPEINLAHTPVGVFGIQRPPTWPLTDQDRIEIYRPLTLPPTEARRRAVRAKAAPRRQNQKPHPT